MTVVAGRNRTKRPFFFTSATGSRVEFPAFGVGQGDLVGLQLREFNMYLSAKQIAPSAAQFPPVNTVAPAVTGTATVGQTLTATNGTWTGTPTPTYTRAWQRSANGTSGWANISGATAATYVLAAADEAQYIRCNVTGTNSAGNATASSNVVGPIAPAA